jgi:phenylalanyl-tRNA synthetase beta subunit
MVTKHEELPAYHCRTLVEITLYNSFTIKNKVFNFIMCNKNDNPKSINISLKEVKCYCGATYKLTQLNKHFKSLGHRIYVKKEQQKAYDD